MLSICFVRVGASKAQPSFRVSRKVHDAHVPFPAFLAQPKVAAVLGAPMTLGQPKAGTDDGPDMLRDAGLLKELKGLGWGVDDQGNLSMPEHSESDPKLDPKYGLARNLRLLGSRQELRGSDAIHEEGRK